MQTRLLKTYMKKLKKILIINGPNLHLLGKREPDFYGSFTLKDLNTLIKKTFRKRVKLTFVQTNYEGKIIDYLTKAFTSYHGIVVNAGAYSHTSIAIADSIRVTSIPVISVHLSDIYSREKYRKKDFVSDAAHKVFYGKKEQSYIEALDYLVSLLNQR